MWRRFLPQWIVLSAICAVAGFMFIRAVSTEREAARQSVCHDRMYHLYEALLKYQLANGHFPPAHVEGPDGTPWHSWRVLLLPYLDERHVYHQYCFDEPWNGPNNSQLADKIDIQLFQCPSGADCGSNFRTNFSVVIGDNTAFPGADTVSTTHLLETTTTIILVEITDSDIHWMEPRDLALDDLAPSKGPRFGSPHPNGVGVVRANRACDRLDRSINIRRLAGQLRLSEAVVVANDGEDFGCGIMLRQIDIPWRDSAYFHIQSCLIETASELDNFLEDVAHRLQHNSMQKHRFIRAVRNAHVDFESDVLLIIRHTEGSGSIIAWIETPRLFGDELVYRVEKYEPLGGTCDGAEYCFAVVVPRVWVKTIRITGARSRIVRTDGPPARWEWTTDDIIMHVDDASRHATEQRDARES